MDQWLLVGTVPDSQLLIHPWQESASSQPRLPCPVQQAPTDGEAILEGDDLVGGAAPKRAWLIWDVGISKISKSGGYFFVCLDMSWPKQWTKKKPELLIQLPWGCWKAHEILWVISMCDLQSVNHVPGTKIIQKRPKPEKNARWVSPCRKDAGQCPSIPILGPRRDVL